METGETEWDELTAEHYRALITHTSDVITVVNEEGTILYQSPSSEHVKGWLPEELVGENILEYVHPDDRDRVANRFSALTEEAGYLDEDIEFRFQSKDKGWIWLAVTGTAPRPDSPIDGYITVSRDITDTKSTEQELQRYKDLVENIPVGIYRNTPGEEGAFVEVNPAMAEMFDADSPEQLLKYSVRDLYADPTERAAFAERLEEEGHVSEVELELETLSGEPFWGSVTAICSTRNGNTYFDGIIQDITQRKEYERQLKTQRDEVETLNQVLRHDIRNDLQLITAYAEQLTEHVDDDGQEYLETIRESAENAVELTNTARELADVMVQTEIDCQPTSLVQAIEEPLSTIRSMYPDAVITVDGTFPDVRVSANELLTSVFRNLLKNAIQHNDTEVAEVTISARTTDTDVTVRIADNGPGISDAQKETIFGKGEKGLESTGTGIGLYLVRSLVESYNGDIWIEDNDPRGAVFIVQLPLSD